LLAGGRQGLRITQGWGNKNRERLKGYDEFNE